MKIIFIIEVGNHKKGDVIEVPEKKAAQFIGSNMAKAHVATKKTPAKKKVTNVKK